MCLILDMCKETEITPIAQVMMRWWEQSGIYMTGARDRDKAADADKDMGGTVTGEKRKAPGMEQRQIKVQHIKIN